MKSIGRNLKWIWRCAKLGLAKERIFLSTPPGHFYSPLPQFSDLEKYDPRPVLEIPGVDMHTESQLQLAKQLAPIIGDHQLAINPTSDRRYYLENGYYPYADGLLLQALMRHLRPNKIVEVGSGFSSAVMLDTCDDYSLSTELTFVEPYPDRLQSLLKDSDLKRTTLIKGFVQDVSSEVFTSLGNGDILFIDSSHVSKFGSDVNHLLFNIIPRLADGVWIHVHDIFWPFEYPLAWYQQGRAWNEAYLLRAFLCHNSQVEVAIFPSYLEQTQAKFMEENWPQTLKRCKDNPLVGGATIWLRVNKRP
jgi:predicted O-methyltransferase YrrM